jgi:hypothetical protein
MDGGPQALAAGRIVTRTGSVTTRLSLYFRCKKQRDQRTEGNRFLSGDPR